MINKRVLQSIVDALKSSRLGVAVQLRGDRITLTRVLGGRLIRVDLMLVDEGLWIRPSRYAFQSKNSHFDYCEPEHRFTRQKSLIVQMVDLLRSTGVWAYVSNKTFFEVNQECTSKKVTKASIKKQLDEALHGEYSKAPVIALPKKR